MLGEFAAVAATVTYRPATVPFVSTLTGRLADADEVARAEYWVRQTREPVRFGDAVRAARAAGCEIFVEAGPHPVLAGLGQQSVADGLWVGTLRRGRAAREQVLEAAATLWTRGVAVDLARVQPGRRVSGLPTYPFERERHWVRPSQGGRRTAGASASAHPLLGERVRSALSTPHFEVRLSATSPAFLRRASRARRGHRPGLAVRRDGAGRRCPDACGRRVCRAVRPRHRSAATPARGRRADRADARAGRGWRDAGRDRRSRRGWRGDELAPARRCDDRARRAARGHGRPRRHPGPVRRGRSGGRALCAPARARCRLRPGVPGCRPDRPRRGRGAGGGCTPGIGGE